MYEGRGCWDTAVVLGLNRDHNAWPFVNGTEVDDSGWSVGKEALWMRDAVYTHAGLPGVWEKEGWVRVGKQAVIGYARREGAGINAGRVFEQEEEEWFVNMLTEEAAKENVQVEIWKEEAEWKEQVRRAERADVIIGIHGANLVNAWWVRPFGGIVEIMPEKYWSECYTGGGNAGLRGWRWRTGVKEEDCEHADCAKFEKYRADVVRIDQGKDGLREMVKQAVAYVKERKTWAAKGGAEVRWDAKRELWVRVQRE